MPQLANRIGQVRPSQTVGLADMVRRLRADGVDVVDLTAGRAAESTPAPIVQAAVKALESGDTHQTAARGTRGYREAISRKLARENGIDADPDTAIIATLGCKQGLMLALLAVINPGDAVIVEDPGFVSHAETIRILGGVPVPVPLRRENDFRWTVTELKQAVTPRTRAILYSSPQNPTGTVHSRTGLECIAELATEHDLTVIADEVYERMAWNGRRHISIASLPGMAARTVTLMGLTKSFSMGGWRIGFATAAPAVIEAMVTMQQHLMTCAGSFTQAGAAAALHDEPPEELTELWADWQRRCAFVCDALNELPRVCCARPEGGFYAWADVRQLASDSEQLARRLLEENHVAVVPGSAFGAAGEGYLRITCVKSWTELRAGIDRLAQGLH